MIWCFYFCIKL